MNRTDHEVFEILRKAFEGLLEIDKVVSGHLSNWRIYFTGFDPFSREDLKRAVLLFCPEALVQEPPIHWGFASDYCMKGLRGELHTKYAREAHQFFEDTSLIVLGRENFDKDLLQYSLQTEVAYLTQEDFLQYFYFGEVSPYYDGDPRIYEHPGLLYLSSVGFEWPSTEAQPSLEPTGNLNPNLDVKSEIARLGYSVRKGVSVKERHNSLAHCVNKLGLERVVRHVAWLTRDRKRMHTDRFDGAIDRWESDLQWLKEKYYDNTPHSKNWPWPMT